MPDTETPWLLNVATRDLAALVDDVREVITDIDRAADDERTSRQHIIECVRARLVELVGEPAAPATPDRITAVVPNRSATGGPFDTITITHPDGTTEVLDVPERVQGCVHAADTAGCRLGPHRLHVTLHAAGYRTAGDPLNLPDAGPHGVGVYTIERITEGN